MTVLPARAAALRRFWFGAEAATRSRGLWFRKSAAFDAELRQLFAADLVAARTGHLDDWQASPAGCVALLLLLDQLPRNLCRGFAEAFASDAQARAVADAAISRGFDAELPVIERIFVYLPFEHSELVADQRRSVALFQSLPVSPPWVTHPGQAGCTVSRWWRCRWWPWPCGAWPGTSPRTGPG